MKRDYSYLLGNQHARGSPPNAASFKKGNRPWNKDKKGIHLSPSTEFKKGQPPFNKLPVGSITMRVDKGNKHRQWIKMGEPRKWIEYAKFVWTKKNGKIPTGLLIHHIDGDTLNDNIDNLAMMTRAAHFEIHEIGKLGRIKRLLNAKKVDR